MAIGVQTARCFTSRRCVLKERISLKQMGASTGSSIKEGRRAQQVRDDKVCYGKERQSIKRMEEAKVVRGSKRR